MRRSAPRAVGEALEGVMRRGEGGTRLRETLALAYWPAAVGEMAAAASQPELVRDGILFVRTRSSTWSHELSLHKEHILAHLNARLGRPLLRDIRFRARGLPAPLAPSPNPYALPPEEELAAVPLAEEDRRAIGAAMAGLGARADERLRRALERRVTYERRVRRWRLEHGWAPCGACGAPHPDDGPRCPICRLEVRG
ncbi:MAG: DUF721 domain-containing protein [Chthonomonadales bacterium]|nr:DUF721 domain-containing protein [Chthonomonadales bacterium]